MNGLLELFAITFSLISLVASVVAIAMVLGLKWSTHKIEWKTVDFEKFEEPVKPEETEDSEQLKAALDLQRKKKKQEDPLDSILETTNF